MLYVTGRTETLVGKEAAVLLPRSNLVVKLHVTAARFAQQGLPFRGIGGEPSPYNPTLRYLSTEKAPIPNSLITQISAQLLSRTLLTPTIARFRFRVSSATSWTAGQYIALSFEDEMGLGYSHMRDEDPRSLNDDYVRTFTISSSPDSDKMPRAELEITIRNVGVVTNWLFRTNLRAAISIPLRGFGGTFTIHPSQNTAFIAGGIGVTPLLAHLDSATPYPIPLFWSLHIRDIGLATDTFIRFPTLRSKAKLFVSGIDGNARPEDIVRLTKLEKEGVKVMRRRIEKEDIHAKAGTVKKWYLCAGKAFREKVMEWVDGEIVWEDFGY